MADIIYAYSRAVREFGRPPDFQDAPPTELIDIHTRPELVEAHTVADMVEREIQCVTQVSEAVTNTEQRHSRNQGQFHREGGWPKEIDVTEEEHKVRYRKKAEKEDSYVASAKALASSAELRVKENNTVDLHEQYFEGEEGGFVDQDPPSLRTLTVFNDPVAKPRAPLYLSWQPIDGRKLAIAYCDLDNYVPNASSLTLDGESLSSFIWDISNPNTPEQRFTASSALTVLQYNPKEANTLAAGTHNGLVCYFDVRQKEKPVMTANVDKSHTHIVQDIQWAQKSSEFLSTATDGTVLFWDTKKMSEPLDTIVLRPKSTEEAGSPIQGGLKIDYSVAAGGASKFMVATEQGNALLCNKRGKSERVLGVFSGHHGPMYAVQRNHFAPKFFLTAGDWRLQLWNEEIKVPLLSTGYHNAYITDAFWHPQRPAVLATSRMDGYVDVWDLTYRHTAPVCSTQVSDAGIARMVVSPFGQFLAASTTKKSTFLIQLSHSLREPLKDEKQTLIQMLERETTRERNLLHRQKELRQRAKRAEESQVEEDRAEYDQKFFSDLTADYLSKLEEGGVEKEFLHQKIKTMPKSAPAEDGPFSEPPPPPEGAEGSGPPPSSSGDVGGGGGGVEGSVDSALQPPPPLEPVEGGEGAVRAEGAEGAVGIGDLATPTAEQIAKAPAPAPAPP